MTYLNNKTKFDFSKKLISSAYKIAKPLVQSAGNKMYDLSKDALKDFVLSVKSPQININDKLLGMYYEKEGLVGEEKLSLLQTYAAIKGINFGIVSKTGSGKSFALEKLIEILPQDEVYILGLGSKTSAFYDQEEINDAKFLYVPELQKAMKGNNLVVEVLKNLTEGKSCERRVVNSKRQVKTFRVDANKSLIFTLAEENLYEIDPEFDRRVLTLKTNNSKKQTRNILDSKIKQRQISSKSPLPRNFKQDLKTHIAYCINSNHKFDNPFVDEIIGKVPSTIKARSYTDHLLDLFEASALFNYQDREIKNNVITVEPADITKVCDLYWSDFIHKIS